MSDNEPKTQMKSCKLCGSQLSPYSPFCRNCGHPQTTTLALWLLAGFLVLLLIFYTAVMLFCACNAEQYRKYNNPALQTTQPANQQQAEPNSLEPGN